MKISMKGNNKEAYALSIILWIVAGILVATVALSSFSKSNVNLSKDLNKKLETQLVTVSLLEILKYYIITADYDNMSYINTNGINLNYNLPEKIILNNQWYKVNDILRFRIIDTSALINVLTYSGKNIAIALTSNEDKQLRSIIESSIEDWKDNDDFVNVNGAETLDYINKKNKLYPVRNKDAIADVDELRLINGIDKLDNDKWNLLKDKLFLGNGNLINLSLVDAKLLSGLLELSLNDAEQLIKVRNDDLEQFYKIVTILPSFNDNLMGFNISRQLVIEIEAQIDDVKSILKTIIDFKPSNFNHYMVIDYQMD